jgi:hypothetical protein
MLTAHVQVLVNMMVLLVVASASPYTLHDCVLIV